MNNIKFKCAVCGKLSVGRIPKGREGTLRFPRRHDLNGLYCPGNLEEAIWVDVTPPAHELGTTLKKDGTLRKKNKTHYNKGQPRKKRNHIRIRSVTIKTTERLGRQLRDVRMSMNMSLKEAQDLSGMSNNLSHLENGTGPYKWRTKAEPLHSITQIFKILKAIGVQEVRFKL